MSIRNCFFLFGFLAVLADPVRVFAEIIQFDFRGSVGNGLLAGNEPGAIVGGSGGEIGTGVTFDDQTRNLTLNFGWGTGNGFANLTGNASAGHIHGPTASGGTAAFTQTAGVKYGLDSLAGWNSNAANGGFSGTVNILATDVAALLNGQFYVNVHTAANGSGEIRGFLTAVPEPSSFAMICLAVSGASFGFLRSRRKKTAIGS